MNPYRNDRHKQEDRRKACLWVSDAMTGAQSVMEQADTNQEFRVAEELYRAADCVESLLKDPEVFDEEKSE